MLTSISRSSLRQVLLRSMTSGDRPMVVSSRFHDQLGFPGLLSDKTKWWHIIWPISYDPYHMIWAITYGLLYHIIKAFYTPVKFVIEKWSNHISKLLKSMNLSRIAQNILRAYKGFLLMKWMSKLTFDPYHHMIVFSELKFGNTDYLYEKILCTQLSLVHFCDLRWPWWDHKS